MFRFSFMETYGDKSQTEEDILRPAIEIFVSDRHLKVLETKNILDMSVENVELKFLKFQGILPFVRDQLSNEFVSFTQENDLVPFIYEGGFTIWECTWDLLNFLSSSNIQFGGKSVLEIGCGCGLLSVYCFLCGAKVTAQDYNEEVLNFMTIPNFLLNTVCDDYGGKSFEEVVAKLTSQAVFYSGDWRSFIHVLKSSFHMKYDIILTSETIYNPLLYGTLLDIFKISLKPEGVVFLSAKSNYFGVGGSLFQFLKIAQDRGFTAKTVLKFNEGVNREVVEMKLINSF